MALAAALASWDEPCTSAFAAWRAEISTVSLRVSDLVQLIEQAETLVKRTIYPRDIASAKPPQLFTSE